MKPQSKHQYSISLFWMHYEWKEIVCIERGYRQLWVKSIRKSIRLGSLGHASESTLGGSDLLYSLIKINLVCPMLKVERQNKKEKIVKYPLLSYYWLSLMLGWQLAVTFPWLWFMACSTGNKIERSSDAPCHAKQTDMIKRLWNDYFDTS